LRKTLGLQSGRDIYPIACDHEPTFEDFVLLKVIDFVHLP